MNMGYFKKLAAGAVSLSLALGTLVTFSAVRPAVNNTAVAASETAERYEYTLENVMISEIDLNDYYPTLKVIPYRYGYYEAFDEYELYFNDVQYRVENSDKLLDKAVLKKTRGYLNLLKKGISVTMTVVLTEDCKDYINNDDPDFPLKRGHTYEIAEIVSLSSPYIQFFGDINADGVVDSFDTIIYRMELAGTNPNKLTKEQLGNADINLNGEVDEDDLENVTDFVLGRTKEFNKAGTLRSVDLCADINEPMAMGKRTDTEFAAAEMNLGVELLKKCFDPTDENKKNSLISPLSISAALAMTANGADGETFSEMEKVLGSGLTIDQLNDYMAYYFQTLPDGEREKLYVADSIWFRDAPTFKVYDEFLNKNVKYYGSQLYKCPFDDTTVNDVNSWVNENTRGMIPSLLQKHQLSPLTMMMLINTLYFECDWADPYEVAYDGIFTDYNGNEHNIKTMYSEEAHYYDLGDADAFDKPFAGGNYKFVGILPHDDDIVKYVNSLDAKKLAEGLSEYEDPETIELHVMIPKFKYSYNASLKKILPELGMEQAFDPTKADFSKINDLSVDGALPLYIDDVLHKTRIEVCEKGVKAAAVTAVMMACGAAMPEPKKKVYIELDRPFVYMILDQNNVPVFIGAASEIEEE